MPNRTKLKMTGLLFPSHPIVDEYIYQLARERKNRAKFWQRKHETPLLTGIPADWLDQQVVLKILEALQRPEQMKEAIIAHLESWERRKRELELLVGHSVKQMKELQDEQERLNYLFRKEEYRYQNTRRKLLRWIRR